MNKKLISKAMEIHKLISEMRDKNDEIHKLKMKVIRLERDKNKEIHELEMQLQEQKSNSDIYQFNEMFQKNNNSDTMKQSERIKELEQKLMQSDIESIENSKWRLFYMSTIFSVKYTNMELLEARRAVGLRDSIEILAKAHQPCFPRRFYPHDYIYRQINEEFETNHAVRTAFNEICEKFNCSTQLDINELHQALSKHDMGHEGFPLDFRLGDETLTPTQWAFVIAFLATKLPRDCICIFDKDDNRIMATDLFSDDPANQMIKKQSSKFK